MSVITSSSVHSLTLPMTSRQDWYMRCHVIWTSSCTTLRQNGAHTSRPTTKLNASMLTTGMTSVASPTCLITMPENSVRIGKQVASSVSTTRDVLCKLTAPEVTDGKSKSTIHSTIRWTNAKSANVRKECSAGTIIKERVTNALSTRCRISSTRRLITQNSLWICHSLNSTTRLWLAFSKTQTTSLNSWSTRNFRTLQSRNCPTYSTNACSPLRLSMPSLTKELYPIPKWSSSALSSTKDLDCTIHHRLFQISTVIQTHRTHHPHSKQ